MKKLGTRFFTPDSIQELCEITEKEQVVTLLAGGTSLLRTINGENLIIPGVIIIMDNIKELKKENRTERYFEFGSMLTIQEIINRSKKNMPTVLIEGLKLNAPYPIRNAATIGGALANKKIMSDLLPLLLIFNCKVEVLRFKNKKNRPKWESITQYMALLTNNNLHLITRIKIPLIIPTYAKYYKTGYKYNLFNEITFAAIAEIEKGNISSLSMAFNIENRKIVRTKRIEAELIGKHLPMNHRMREPLTQSIISSLDVIEDLTKNQRYRMMQIILHFLEEF